VAGVFLHTYLVHSTYVFLCTRATKVGKIVNPAVNFGQPGRFFPTFSVHNFFGTFFFIQDNIITILEAEQPGRQSEGNFNRGFSTKTYPAIYLPNIIPA